jgi:hypothetical protein
MAAPRGLVPWTVFHLMSVTALHGVRPFGGARTLRVTSVLELVRAEIDCFEGPLLVY